MSRAIASPASSTRNPQCLRRLGHAGPGDQLRGSAPATIRKLSFGLALILSGCGYKVKQHREDEAKWARDTQIEQKQEHTEKKAEKKTDRRRVTTYEPGGRIIVDETLSEILSDLAASDGVVTTIKDKSTAEVKQMEDVEKAPVNTGWNWRTRILVALALFILGVIAAWKVSRRLGML